MAVEHAIAYKTTSGSVTTTLAAMVFQAEQDDNISAVNLGTSTSQFTVTSTYNGRYGRFRFAAHIGAVSNEGESRKNGAAYRGGGKHGDESSGSNGISAVSAPLTLATNDYFEAFIRNFTTSSGTNTNQRCWGELEIFGLWYNGAVVGKSANQGLSANTLTAVTWDTEDYDLNGWHDNVTNNNRFTVPSSGVSLVRISANIAADASTDEAQLISHKNGSSFYGGFFQDIQYTGSRARYVNAISAPIAVAAGDYFECMALLTTALNIKTDNNSWFAIQALPSDLKYALVRKTSDQSIGTQTNTKVTFDTAVADTSSWFNISNPTRLTVPSGVTRVRVTANVSRASATGQSVLTFQMNNAEFVGNVQRDTDTNGTDNINIQSAIISVVAGDYFEILAFFESSSNATASVDTWFSIEEVVTNDITVSPATGPIGGGTALTITGHLFTGATGVTIDGVACTSFTVVSDNTITCTSPAGTSGVRDIIIQRPSTNITLTGAFTYTGGTVTSVSPSSGAVAGGTAVTVTGTAFTGATDVKFGGVSATSIVVVNSTTITCVTPAGSAGVVSCQVFTPTQGNPILASAFTYVAAINSSVILDYAIAFNKTLILDYGIQFDKSLILDYSIILGQDLTLDYTIQLSAEVILTYVVGILDYPYFDYHAAKHSTAVENEADFTWSATPIDAVPALSTAGAATPPSHFVGGTGTLYLVNNFYGDIYFRIWLDPAFRALSNPRIGVPFTFNIWNAYPDNNPLIETLLTDLPGVQFNYTMPLAFTRYEYKTLSFQLTTDAPAEIDGYADFIFEQGQAQFHLIATIVSALTSIPGEPVQEKWIWDTVVNIAKASEESRAAMRNEPRYQVSYTTNIVDEASRRTYYEQLWTFLSRDLQVPLFQYKTPLTAFSAAGTTRVYFNPALTDIRADEYFVLFNTADKSFTLARGTLNIDGVTLDGALNDNVDANWWAVPTITMRPSNGSGLSIGALTGTAGVLMASTKKRALLAAPISPSLLTHFNGVPVLADRMIAQNELDDKFDQDVEAVDGALETLLYTQWPQPFITGPREWKFDREDPNQLKYWKEFGDYVKGSQKHFLVPTWREDLTLFSAPSLGTSVLQIDQPGFSLMAANGAYSRLQLLSANGIKYFSVISVTDFGAYVEVSLNTGIGVVSGDEDIQMISFLNLCRLADDSITLMHYANWSVASMTIRTIDE